MKLTRRIARTAALIVVLSCINPAADVVDRILVAINSRVILQSDLETEIKLEKLMSGQAPNPETVMERLIDRMLLEQEMKGLDLLPELDPQITTRLTEVRKQLKGAETEEGWRKLLAEGGLTEDDIRERIVDELNTALFLEAKFRPSLRVNHARIQSYYKEVFVPEMKKRAEAAPPLEQVSQQIEQILTEQTLNDLFGEWIRGLRAQARIRVIDPTVRLEGTEAHSSLNGMNFPPLRISQEQVATPGTTTPAKAPVEPQQR